MGGVGGLARCVGRAGAPTELESGGEGGAFSRRAAKVAKHRVKRLSFPLGKAGRIWDKNQYAVVGSLERFTPAAVCLAACSSAVTGVGPDDSGPAPTPSSGSSSGGGVSGTDTAASPDASLGSSSSSGGGSAGGSSSGSTSSSSGGRVADASTADVRDAAAAKDSFVVADAGAGAAVAPYKGVANSACNDLQTLTTSWWYNWETSPGSCKVGEFVPMVWGHTGAEQTTTGVANEVKSAVSGGWGTVLGFNEPDNTGRCRTSPWRRPSRSGPPFIQTGRASAARRPRGNIDGSDLDSRPS